VTGGGVRNAASFQVGRRRADDHLDSAIFSRETIAIPKCPTEAELNVLSDHVYAAVDEPKLYRHRPLAAQELREQRRIHICHQLGGTYSGSARMAHRAGLQRQFCDLLKFTKDLFRALVSRRPVIRQRAGASAQSIVASRTVLHAEIWLLTEVSELGSDRPRRQLSPASTTRAKVAIAAIRSTSPLLRFSQ